MGRLDDDGLTTDIGSSLEADEADLLDQGEVAVSDDLLDEELDALEDDDE